MSAVTNKFIYLFKRALTNSEGGKDKSVKQKEKEYYELTFFINGLKKTDDFQTCLDEYLKIYKDYQSADRRSKFVFALLIVKRIESTKPADKYIDSLSDIINDTQKPFTNPIKLRYEDSEDKEKKEIKGALDFKLLLQKQEMSVIDLLKKQYEKENKKVPDEKALLNYNTVTDSKYAEIFQSRISKVREAWSKNDTEAIEPALNNYISLLYKENDPMKLFQVIKWLRDIVTDQPYKIFINERGKEEKYKHSHDVLDCEFYFQAIYWLLVWAKKKAYYKNRRNFTPEEKSFFIDPLRKEYYFSNFYNRFETGAAENRDISKASVLFLRLLMFARMNRATLANDKEVSMVISILQDKSLRPALKKKNFYLDVGHELFRGYVRIGSNMGKCRVIYFYDYKNDDSEFIFIEFIGVENVLLKVSAKRLADINEDSFYTIVWENTRHLLVLIPAFWKFLGYLTTFITGGAFALVKEIAVDLVIGEVAEHVGPSSNVSIALNLGLALFRKGKFDSGTFERSVSKGLKNLGKQEAEAARALLKMTDAELKAARLAGKLTEEEVRAIKAASKYIDDEAKAMKAVDELVVEETKAVNSKADVTNYKSNATLSASNNPVSKGTAQNTKLTSVDDVVKNNGTGKIKGDGGGSVIIGNYIPDLKKGGVIDLKDAVKIVEDAGEGSLWVKKIDDINKISDRAARGRAINQFIYDYAASRNVRVEIVFNSQATARKFSDTTLARFDPASNKILVRETIFDAPDSIKQLRQAVKSSETSKAIRDMKFPKDFEAKVVVMHQHLRDKAQDLPDFIKMHTRRLSITTAEAEQITDDLFAKSVWLRDLKRINQLRDPVKRMKELKDFMAVYSHHSAINIKILPKSAAEAKGLGAATRNWGTFSETERTIYMHEEVLILNGTRPVEEVAHEVGAAELYRVLGIRKDAIPVISNPVQGRGRFLTHVIDSYI